MNELEKSLGYEEADKIFRDFFRGELRGFSDERGFLWIATHYGFDTLTWEPFEKNSIFKKGQYEVAVRFHGKSDDSMYKHPGYVARDGYMTGFGTGGH